MSQGLVGSSPAPAQDSHDAMAVSAPGAVASAAEGGPSFPTAPTTAVETLLQASTKAVPGVRHVSISLVERGGAVRPLAASGQVSRRVEELQVMLREGPSVDVLHGDEPVVGLLVGCPQDAARWPELAPRLDALGLRSVLAVRMVWERKAVGVMTLAGDSREGLPCETVVLATALAAHAAATLGLARKAEQLELAMVTRQEVGQAVGILMERYGLTPEAAFAYLRRLSQNRNVKLRDIADQLRLTGRLPGDEAPHDSEAGDLEPAGADTPSSIASAPA
ncbi:GAF and ANTAR domain-containing protein [Terrabacter sp. NPDC080008]|uniref:GAF and ANTAR domain-containing protein n=1 Tax=Terrabacter sp. NPDC080008 TaxID=3155176 RepID=UPI00344B1322